jgi:hypothetical protein
MQPQLRYPRNAAQMGWEDGHEDEHPSLDRQKLKLSANLIRRYESLASTCMMPPRGPDYRKDLCDFFE